MTHYSVVLNETSFGYFDYLENKNEYLKIITEEIENIKCRKIIKQTLNDIVDEIGIIKILSKMIFIIYFSSTKALIFKTTIFGSVLAVTVTVLLCSFNCPGFGWNTTSILSFLPG